MVKTDQKCQKKNMNIFNNNDSVLDIFDQKNSAHAQPIYQTKCSPIFGPAKKTHTEKWRGNQSNGNVNH